MTLPDPLTEFVLPNPALRQAVSQICQRDRDFLKIEANAGGLQVRRWEPTLASLVRIIIGQQLSSRAAQAIFLRLTQAIPITPSELATCPELTLKQAGLSSAKITTCKRLANALLEGSLDLNAIAARSDREAVEELTRIKGIGVWTAEVYLLFCLERLSIFPASDLAIQTSYQLLKQYPQRPTRKELLELCQPLEPWLGAVAHLLWHYYRYHLKEIAAPSASI